LLHGQTATVEAEMMTSAQNLRVLIIDDDPYILKSISIYLEDLGFEVYQAGGGRQGIEMFEAVTPNLVFTDLMMPDVDGLMVVQEITAKSPDTPVVIISGNGSIDFAIDAVRNGAWDYITKPIHDFSVIDIITDRVLDRAREKREQREHHLSLHAAVTQALDPLTRLPMRKHLNDKFNEIVANREFTGSLIIVLVELENYKAIVEKFSHNYGDHLIVEFTGQLKPLITPNLAIVRIESNEFAIMIANAPDVSRHVSAICQLISKPFDILGNEIYATYNIGIASFPHDGESVDSLLQNADIARAHAKSLGRNQYCYYSRELMKQVQSKIELEYGLRNALRRNEFSLHYQPKIDSASRKIIGMEALLRWQPAGMNQLLTPDDFIPMLEESTMILEVGSWVLETACAQYVDWRQQGMEPIRISVNISALQLHAGGLKDLVIAILESTGMEPECLCLELTESIVVKDVETTIETLDALSALGIKLSIDDFGTGYSSLSYLRRMPIDELKIDRSFVTNLPHDPASVAIVDSVLGISKGMHMTVVAEGVERSEQADFLTERGCHELQGYLFSTPLAGDDFLEWYRSNR